MICRADKVIQLEAGGRVRDLSVAWDPDRVVVSGRVPTFYVKQLVIAACRKVLGITSAERLAAAIHVEHQR